MTLKGCRRLRAGFPLLFGDFPAESWMRRVAVLLGSSTDFLSGCAASSRAEISKEESESNQKLPVETPEGVDSVQGVVEVSAGLLQRRRQPLNWEGESRSVLLLWKRLIFVES